MNKIFALIGLSTLIATAEVKVLDFYYLVAGEIEYHVDAITESHTVFDKFAKDLSWTVVHSKDPKIFSDTGIGKFDVIIMNNNQGNIFNASQKLALETYIHKGGGVVGIHAASYAHKIPGEWPWWENFIGKLHVSGPPAKGYVGPGTNTIIMQDTSKRFTIGLPKQWVMDSVEWYKYNRELPQTMHVLVTADPAKEMAGYPAYYPVSWCQHFDGGRMWYTNMGHFADEFKNANCLKHLLQGIGWAALGKTGGCDEPEIPVTIRRPFGRIAPQGTVAGRPIWEEEYFFSAAGVKLGNHQPPPLQTLFFRIGQAGRGKLVGTEGIEPSTR